MMISYHDLLSYLLPEVVLTCTALAILMLDVAALRKTATAIRLAVGATIGIIACTAAAYLVMAKPLDLRLSDGLLVIDPVARLAMVGVLILTGFALLLSLGLRDVDDVGEYFLLILLSSVGMMLLVSTQNLLVLFVSLELLSLSLYLMTAFDKRSRAATEGSLKYFLFGAMSAAVLLYGFSMLYGFANSTDLNVIGAAIAARGSGPVVIFAAVAVFVGLGFKVAAAPFHFWVPDVYESAPSQVVGFLASASKLASFYALFTVLTLGFGAFAGSAGWRHVTEGWVPVCAGLAALSMLVGNVGALAQTSVRRLLGYSAIAHSGYMLIAMTAHTAASRGALLFYLLTYGISVLGGFAVVEVVQQQTGSDSLASFCGLSRRLPILSACMFVFLLSQAGIPPLAGFFGKFYLFAAAISGNSGDRGLLWLVVFAFAMSAVSLYYYLQVLKRIFVAAPEEGAKALDAPKAVTIVVSVLAFLTLLLGVLPNLVYGWIGAAVQALHP